MNKEIETLPQQIFVMLNNLRNPAHVGMFQIGNYRELMSVATPEEVRIGVLLFLECMTKAITESAEYQLKELNEYITSLQQTEDPSMGIKIPLNEEKP